MIIEPNVRTEFETFSSFLKENDEYLTHQCKECNGTLELNPMDVDIVIENRKMHIQGFFLLTCLNCKKKYLPYYLKEMIAKVYEQWVENNQYEGHLKWNGIKKHFGYCVKQDFIYDYRDYYYIPGLCFDEEHSTEGFLTPVYFSKKVLLYFMNDPDYEVNLRSESFGDIRLADQWVITFGINRNGNVVFWLGDLDDVDEHTLSIMKPHNIESDHQLTDSEFFAAEMGCVPSEPNNELQACYKKRELFEEIYKKYRIDLFHLNQEVRDQIQGFIKPIVFTEKTIEPAINMLHKVLIEGVNIDEFRKLCVTVTGKQMDEYNNLGSIKLYEVLLENIVNNHDDVRNIISPLYLLNDLRQFFDHLLSKAKRDKIKKNIVESLEMNSFDDIGEVYQNLIKKINTLFEYLIIGYSI